MSAGESLSSLEHFKAGRIAGFIKQWENITTDQFILQLVRGAKIPLVRHDYTGINFHPQNRIPGDKLPFLEAEITKLLEMGVIEKSVFEKDQVISPVFLVDKSDGTFRMILDLKKFNESVEYEHFKMENLYTALLMVQKDCYMASVDLRHAYYSVPIHKDFRKYLKFAWKGQLYEYTCFPNGLSNCPRYFTKLLKPVYSTLRSKGFLSASFIDDCYLQGSTFTECCANVQATLDLFQSLGLVIHQDKSVLTPCKEIKYLGFVINSDNMTVRLTQEKVKKITENCQSVLEQSSIKIRALAQLIGQFVASFPGVLWGPLFYRELERLKTQALKYNRGNYEASVVLSKDAKAEILWWKSSLPDSFAPIQRADPQVILTTDASNAGWGAVCESVKTGGRWSLIEKINHINVLELMAIELALKSFASKFIHKHVKILTDNACAVAYITHMGGSKSRECNAVANRIWLWCKDRGIWLSVSHIAGKENVDADQSSRVFNDRTEWQLNPNIFEKLKGGLFCPKIDLFASRLNFQMKPYISWGPDPESVAVDAFSISWTEWNSVYAFPPFSLILRTLDKWRRDGVDGMMIVPMWPTAAWFPVMLRMLVHPPVLLPRGQRILQLPSSSEFHPLHRKLQMMACVLSGKPTKPKDFREKRWRSCAPHGEIPLSDNTLRTCLSGTVFAVNGVTIPCLQMYA